jgi:thiol:disulfide interchange protein DsbA
MNRRVFNAAAATVAGLTALGIPHLAWAQRKPEEGTDYKKLDKVVATETTGGKVEVIEFFWYSCPHCNAFEPRLVNWIKRQSPDVVVRRVPVAFRDDFVPQQRLYYVLEAMNRLDDLHPKVFEAIHARKELLNREDLIVAWAEKNGLDRAKFQELYNSFAVQTKARRAHQLQEAFKVEGVPALGIAGRWYTDGSMAGNMDRALQVADYLVAEARKTR